MPFLPPFDRYFLPTFINYHTQYGSDGAALAFRFSVFSKKIQRKCTGAKIAETEKSEKTKNHENLKNGQADFQTA
ncbi:hypothetical protein [Neisseria animaloris]|uniref:hypothetical protein n=1 Tax=Neisseria animaloris TaxID=326522 RepID=UPI00131DA4B0|nr:hypothetical protein [Neisseria animaloris]